ncbi:MAG: nucleotidyltransferase domain-containing protein [Candidatus Eremiobacteraeota bacterium]|nr:nucleotidyltransferase domain-containing protein [Candidatus Eremiobacteraeota bacterium]
MNELSRLTPFEHHIAAEFARRVRERKGKRILLMKVFGSRARGEARADSDLDILVLLDEMSLPDSREICAVATDLLLEKELPFQISPRVMTKAHFEEIMSRELLFPKEVERDGITV